MSVGSEPQSGPDWGHTTTSAGQVSRARLLGSARLGSALGVNRAAAGAQSWHRDRTDCTQLRPRVIPPRAVAQRGAGPAGRQTVLRHIAQCIVVAPGRVAPRRAVQVVLVHRAAIVELCWAGRT